MTERTPRKPPRDYSFDSGLSSPGSNLSQDEMYFSNFNSRMTRHMSMDRIQLDRHKIYRSICDLQTEAQQVQHLVDDMTSTQTMRRRRKATSGLSIKARKERATESLFSYTPIAPGESEWGRRFDEIIARLKGCEPSADEAHICDEQECETEDCAMKATSTNLEDDVDSKLTINKDELNESSLTDDTSKADNNLADIENTTSSESTVSTESVNSLVISESADDLRNLEFTSNISDATNSQNHTNAGNTAGTAYDEDTVEICESEIQANRSWETYKSEPILSLAEDNTEIGQSETSCDDHIQQTDSMNNITSYEKRQEFQSHPAIINGDNTVTACVVVHQHQDYEYEKYSPPTPLKNNRMCQSMTEESLRPSVADTKKMLRSISFYRPNMAGHHVTPLRRTDSSKLLNTIFGFYTILSIVNCQ